MIVEWSLPGAPRGGEDKCNTSRVKRRVPPRFINKHKEMRAEPGRTQHLFFRSSAGKYTRRSPSLPSRRQAGQAMCAFPRDRQGRQKAMCAPCPRPACLRPAQSGFKVGKKPAGGWVILGQNIALFCKKAARGADGRAAGSVSANCAPRKAPGNARQPLPESCRNFYPKAQQLLPKSCRNFYPKVAATSTHELLQLLPQSSAASTPKLLRVWGTVCRSRTHGQPRVWGTMCGEGGVWTAEDMGYRLPSFLAGAAGVAGTAC